MAVLFLVLLLTSGGVSKDLSSSLARCHQISRSRDYRISGKMQLLLKISKEGRVNTLRVQKDTTGSIILKRCVRFHIQKNIFPAGKASYETTLKLNFPFGKTQYSVLINDVPLLKGLGNGCAVRMLLDKKNVRARKGAMVALRISRKGKINPMANIKSDMAMMVTQGTGTFQWIDRKGNQQYRPVSSGSLVVIPRGTVFSASGSSTPPLVMLVFFNKPGGEEFFSGNLSSKSIVLMSPDGFTAAQKKILSGIKNSGKVRTFDTVLKKKFLKSKVSRIFSDGKSALEAGIVRITPSKKHSIISHGETFGFILQGGGEAGIKGEIVPFKSGSGVFFNSSFSIQSRLKNTPVIMVYFNNGGALRLK
ncbi:MAG: hypothetical protein JXR95_06850 [Deltaproteobacteria bacterium]|nr:hypothetical protein [Deltaproteobacteria bacterium]